MYVVLTQPVNNLGQMGDIVQVKRGYFVNYLYPNKMAEFATEKRVVATAQERKDRVLRMEELKAKARDIADKLSGFSLSVAAKASDKGKLYGSVDEKMIVSLLAEQAKLEILPEQVSMSEHFKQVGDYSVTLKLSDEVSTDIAVNVVASSE